MKLGHKQFSHHHVHRLFHISMGLCFAFILLTIVAGMVSVWLQAGADTTPKSGTMTVTAIVGGINPGPITSGGSSIPPSNNQIPTITIYAEPYGQVPQKAVVVGQNTVPAYAFLSANPAFSGQSSVGNSLIFLSISGPQNFNSTALAGNDGKWFWQSPEKFKPGIYTIIATVYNPNDLTKFSTAKTYFVISEQDNNPTQPEFPGTGQPTGQPGEQPGENGLGKALFGIFFEVLKDYKKITVGKEVVVAITLVNNNPKIEVHDQEIEYKVIGVDGKVIMESKDTVSFSSISRFLKTILTAPRTKPGVYTVQVTSTYEGITSTASDTFVLEPFLFSENESDTSPMILWSALAGLLLLFLFLVLVAYHQVRLVTRHIHEHNNRWHKD